LQIPDIREYKKNHANSELPVKSSKNKPLTKDDKRKNRKQSLGRVAVENIIRDVKIFRMIAEKYRNRWLLSGVEVRKRFGLRFNLIAAIYNLNLNYKL
jgi:predicted restriction endonuclease